MEKLRIYTFTSFILLFWSVLSLCLMDNNFIFKLKSLIIIRNNFRIFLLMSFSTKTIRTINIAWLYVRVYRNYGWLKISAMNQSIAQVCLSSYVKSIFGLNIPVCTARIHGWSELAVFIDTRYGHWICVHVVERKTFIFVWMLNGHFN